MARNRTGGETMRDLLKGVLAGGLLALLLIGAAARAYRTRSLSPSANATAAPAGTAQATPTLVVIYQNPQTVLARAEALLGDEQKPREAIALLMPLLDGLEDLPERGQVYSLLSEAEAALGHYQIAAGYAAWAAELDPRPESFYNLAQLYDLGGDLQAAYEAYYTVTWSGDPAVSGSIYAQAKNRMDQIAVMIFTPTPPP